MALLSEDGDDAAVENFTCKITASYIVLTTSSTLTRVMCGIVLKTAGSTAAGDLYHISNATVRAGAPRGQRDIAVRRSRVVLCPTYVQVIVTSHQLCARNACYATRCNKKRDLRVRRSVDASAHMRLT